MLECVIRIVGGSDSTSLLLKEYALAVHATALHCMGLHYIVDWVAIAIPAVHSNA